MTRHRHWRGLSPSPLLSCFVGDVPSRTRRQESARFIMSPTTCAAIPDAAASRNDRPSGSRARSRSDGTTVNSAHVPVILPPPDMPATSCTPHTRSPTRIPLLAPSPSCTSGPTATTSPANSHPPISGRRDVGRAAWKNRPPPAVSWRRATSSTLMAAARTRTVTWRARGGGGVGTSPMTMVSATVPTVHQEVTCAAFMVERTMVRRWEFLLATGVPSVHPPSVFR
mmetsp:Transcript_7471/g.20792  ORF Transcript_7471/g.20792 Transcript_7471/m.20792 type:complete len:226 (+) Transcript_7471:636-1313(+)